MLIYLEYKFYYNTKDLVNLHSWHQMKLAKECPKTLKICTPSLLVDILVASIWGNEINKNIYATHEYNCILVGLVHRFTVESFIGLDQRRGGFASTKGT